VLQAIADHPIHVGQLQTGEVLGDFFRHCPECQGLARERWIQQRLAELLPVEYFHVVFTTAAGDDGPPRSSSAVSCCMHCRPGFSVSVTMACWPTASARRSLQLCRQQLAAPTADRLPVPQDYRDFYAALTGKNLRLCPECGIGTMVRIEILPACPSAASLRMDSS